MAKAENRLKGSYQNILGLPMTAANIPAGQNWYPEAHKIAFTIGVLAGYSGDRAVEVGAGIISALSPRTEWMSNINKAILLATEAIQKHTLQQHNKAMKILDGAAPEDVLGPRAFKTQAFYKAILDPNNDYSPPVIDRHAVGVYMGRPVTDRQQRALESPKVYGRVERAYLRAAREVGTNHHVLQAQTWSQWRTNKGVITTENSRQLTIE